MPIFQPNPIDYLGLIAAQTFPPGVTDPLEAARYFSANRIFNLYTPGLRPNLPATAEFIAFVDDPDDANAALVIHPPDTSAADTAGIVEQQILLGRRVVLVDLSQPDDDRGDPALLIALTSSTVYVSNLAAYDVDLRRALAAALTPLRDGAAHRRYLVDTMLYYWAWRGIVENEVRSAFGDEIPEAKLLRATTQTKSRLGAYLLKLRGRGLRYFLTAVGFKDRRVDGFWFDLEAEG